jgi:hypothetical protein
MIIPEGVFSADSAKSFTLYDMGIGEEGKLPPVDAKRTKTDKNGKQYVVDDGQLYSCYPTPGDRQLTVRFNQVGVMSYNHDLVLANPPRVSEGSKSDITLCVTKRVEASEYSPVQDYPIVLKVTQILPTGCEVTTDEQNQLVNLLVSLLKDHSNAGTLPKINRGALRLSDI